jgi:hypothetical protein
VAVGILKGERPNTENLGDILDRMGITDLPGLPN